MKHVKKSVLLWHTPHEIYRLVIDVENKRVAAPAIALDVPFELDDFTQHRLLNGLDDIGLTLKSADEITTYESDRAAWMPTVSP